VSPHVAEDDTDRRDVADAAAAWLHYLEQDRRRKPSTVSGDQAIVRARLLPAFDLMPNESITPKTMIEGWLAGVDRASSTRVKALVLMRRIFQRARKVWGATGESGSRRREAGVRVVTSGSSRPRIWSLVRAAGSEQDAALLLPAEGVSILRATSARAQPSMPVRVLDT
jgi:hypothetical protein